MAAEVVGALGPAGCGMSAGESTVVRIAAAGTVFVPPVGAVRVPGWAGLADFATVPGPLRQDGRR
jgi:hypothetical protein